MKRKSILFVVGFIIVLISLELILRLGGWVFLAVQEIHNKEPFITSGDYRILALGESTTALGGDQSWPSQLEKILHEKYPTKHVSVINKGVPGITSAGILRDLEKNLAAYQPQMVIAMIGVNDGSSGRDLFVVDQDVSRDSLFVAVMKQLRIYKLGLFLQNILFPSKTTETWREKTLDAARFQDPHNDWELVELGNFWIDQGDFSLAEKLFQKAIAIAPDHDWPLIELANLYRNEKRYEEAERLYRQAISLNPNRSDPYLELSDVYRKTGRLEEARIMFVKAQALDPSVSMSEDIGTRYRHPGRYKEKEQLLLSATRQDATNSGLLVTLATFYRDRGSLEEARMMFEKALALDPKNPDILTQLGLVYRDLERMNEAESSLKEALALDPSRDIALHVLSDIYRSAGKIEEAEATDAQILSSNTTLRTNYQAIKEMVGKRGIPFVAVQYPMRSAVPLQSMLGTRDVLYVDNEKVFRDAVAASSYAEYFEDRFGGNFGHATAKGNELLAKNIADVLEAIMSKDIP